LEECDGPDLEEEAGKEVDKVLEELAIDASIRLAVTQPAAAAAAAQSSGAR